MKVPLKETQFTEGQDFESFWVGEHREVQGEWHAWRGDGSSGPLPTYPAQCTTSIWQFLSHISFYSKLVT